MLIPPMIGLPDIANSPTQARELQIRRLQPDFMMFPRHEGRVNDFSVSTPTVDWFEGNCDQPIASVATFKSSMSQASGGKFDKEIKRGE